MFTIHAIVDFYKNRITLEQGLQFNAVLNDSGSAYKIIFHFKQPINYENTTGTLNFLLPDQTTYQDNITFKNECIAYYVLNDILLSQIGKVQMSLSLIDNNRFTIYNNLVMNVRETI